MLEKLKKYKESEQNIYCMKKKNNVTYIATNLTEFNHNLSKIQR